MVQGRGSACQGMTIAVILLVSLVYCEIVHATTFTVGDSEGWTFNVETWPDGKKFMAGDILVFNYNKDFHNLVLVDKQGYDTCKPANGAKEYRSGSDSITLAKGQNYFICSLPNHCESKMKISVNAE
ncbi:hypothetical protein AQUCO_06900052v1 [Aquilegia coerulea]|uniref:Plantacyanin n=1 Tax=Aquilegia coerulea TaxID=218851 RepID=A0A2G5CB82_AQUCA|nr:hypothetical protein AQUCO_06900052v1 [Aquilegia coerulea]